MKKCLLCLFLPAFAWSLHAESGDLKIVHRVTLKAADHQITHQLLPPATHYHTTAVLGEDGKLYVAQITMKRGVMTGPGLVTIVDPSGRKLGEFARADMVSPAFGVDADGTIYYASYEFERETEKELPSVIRVLSPDLKLQRTISTRWTKIERIFPFGDRLYLIALRGEGAKELIDGNVVHVYSKDGQFIKSFARWDERIISFDERYNAALCSSLAINSKRRELIFCRQSEFTLEVYDLNGNLKRQIPFGPGAGMPSNAAYRVLGLHLLGNQLISHVALPNSEGDVRPYLHVFDTQTEKVVSRIEIPRHYGRLVGVGQQGDLYFLKSLEGLEMIKARLSAY